MRRLLLASAALLMNLPTTAWAQDANVAVVWGASTPPPCPQPVDGGCAASPGGNFTQAGFSAHARQSSQTWTSSHPWNWNSCGIDYACGYYTALGSLLDPAVSAPTGCTYNATGSTLGGAILNCTGVVNITGYNLSLHNCVPVRMDSGVTSLTIKDNYDAAGSNCSGQNEPGFGSYMFIIINSATVSPDIESNYIDGGGATYTMANTFIGGFVGSMTLKYNVVKNSYNNPFQMTHLNNVLSQYNYIENYAFGTGHGEYFLTGASSGSATIQSSYDTILQGSAVAQNTTTALVYISAGQTGPTITSADCDHDVLIANNNSGTNTTSALCEASYSTYTNITISNNYVDATGSLATWVATSTPTCTNPAVFSNNVSLVDGTSKNAWTSNNGTGC